MFLTKHIKNWSDEDLVSKYKADSDPRCIGELFERYTDMVYLTCMKYLKDEMESEDAAMRIFEKLIQDLKKYEIKRFKYWLHTVTKNHCFVILDKHKRLRDKNEQYHNGKREESLEMTLDYLDGASPEEIQLQQLERALPMLSAEQRTCLDLFYLQQKRYKEVAEITGYSMKQVKSYIQNGKRNLKKLMEQQQVNE